MKRSTFLKNLIGFYGISGLPLEMVKQYQKIYLLQCFVRGFQFYNGPKLLHQINKTGLLELVREPNNKYDKNAIALHFNKQKIGFIPAESNEVLARLMDANLIELQAEIAFVEPEAASWENVFVAIYALKELEFFESNEQYNQFSILETPDYYTLKSSPNEYTRIFFDADDNLPQETVIDYYQQLVDHSTTDDIYTFIHTNFPSESKFNEAFYHNKLVLRTNENSSLNDYLNGFCNNVIYEIKEVENKVAHKVKFLEVKVDELVKIPDKIKKIVEVIDEKGNVFFEVVLKTE